MYESTLADAYVTVANGDHQRGENDRYPEFAGKDVQTNPLSARLHLMLSDAYRVSSAGEDAIKQHRPVLELEPDHADRVRLVNRIRGHEDVAGE